MATTRAQYRSHIGRALGRNYWDSSTVGAGCTVNKLFDPKRTEYAAFWDGASLLVSGEEVYVRGGGGPNQRGTGVLFLDRDLAGAPVNGTAYEILKGWTFADVDESLDFSFGHTYPEFRQSTTDISVALEVANQLVYPLTSTWERVVAVEREALKGSTPAWYYDLYEGTDYRITVSDAGALQLEIMFTPEAGRKIRIRAESRPSIASGDAGVGTVDIPWQVITPGALHYLYDKGIEADETAGSLRQVFSEEAQRQLALFEQRKTEYRPHIQRRRGAFPVIGERNDGTSVTGS